VGKKKFGGATWERSCCSPLPGRNARLDVAVFSRFATPAPVRTADSPSNRSFRGAGLERKRVQDSTAMAEDSVDVLIVGAGAALRGRTLDLVAALLVPRPHPLSRLDLTTTIGRRKGAA